MENDGLTNEQTEQVLQFQDITGIEDMNVCRDMLIRHHWNLEIAYLENQNFREGRPSLYAQSTEARMPTVLNDRYMQHVFPSPRRNRAVVLNNNGGPPPGTGVFGVIGYFVNYVISLCYNTFSSVIQTLISIFGERERIVTDPLGDVLKFIAAYDAKYPVHPVFYHGTYAQALNDAKRELKFLLVYLHSERNSPIAAITAPGAPQAITETANFCQNTLSNPEVIQYINQNMLCWACDVASPEGYRVSHSINARSYPLSVIIGLRSNKMVVMGRLEGDCNVTEMMRRMRIVISENELYLNQARNDRLERSFTQTLRQQQDLAYEESLKADQEKEKRKQEQRDAQQRVEQALEAERFAEQRRKELIEQLKLEMVDQVPCEPADTKDAISIVFKLPNGMRVTRRFLPEHSLNDIHNFIFCHPDAPNSFEITTNFPKRVLDCGKLNLDSLNGMNGSFNLAAMLQVSKENIQTIGEAKLENRVALFVSDLDA